MQKNDELGAKGKRLLAMLVGEIIKGRFVKEDPTTFIGYGEALDKMKLPRRGTAGQQLQQEGLIELNDWTKLHPELPKITGFLVDKKLNRPGPGFAPSHGHMERDWQKWWLEETTRALEFPQWSRYLGKETSANPGTATTPPVAKKGPEKKDASKIRSVDPGKRGK